MDFILKRFTGVVSGLVIYKDRMQQNLEMTRGVIFSGTLLITLTDHGIAREEAYRAVQKHAMLAYEGGADFAERVRLDPRITQAVPKDVLDEVFDLQRHLKYVDLIFERAMAL